MNDIKIEEQMNTQPFYVVEDTSYDRMMKKLQSGEKYVKSYIHHNCPYKSSKDECKCPFSLNFLKDGVMVRANNGVLKPVFSKTFICKVFNTGIKTI